MLKSFGTGTKLKQKETFAMVGAHMRIEEIRMPRRVVEEEKRKEEQEIGDEQEWEDSQG